MISTIQVIKKDLEVNMQKCINNFKTSINKVHIDRVSSDMLNHIMVDYNGILTPILHLSNFTVENSRTLSITAFDSNMTKKIEKAILSSDIGLVPVVFKNVIRIILPALTEDRRRKLIKVVRFEAEKSKISIRNVRRIFNEKIKNLFKRKEINEDEEHFFQNEIQNLTNFWINRIEVILKEKESGLMKF